MVKSFNQSTDLSLSYIPLVKDLSVVRALSHESINNIEQVIIENDEGGAELYFVERFPWYGDLSQVCFNCKVMDYRLSHDWLINTFR